MKKLVIGFMLVAVLVLPAVARGAAEEIEERRSVTVAVPSLPAMLEPGAMISVNMYAVSFNIFDTLIKNDFLEDRGLMPGLAESWEYIDDTTLEVRLRQGVVFHNGSEFTSRDVAVTFSDERLMGPEPAVETPSPRGYWATFDGVEVVDDYTVRFHTTDPDGVIPQLLTMPAYQIISADAYESYDDFADWGANPVGSGPFKIAEWISEERLHLVANPDYWAGAPHIDELTFVVVPEESGRIAGLIAGDYDIIRDVGPDNFPLIQTQPGFEVIGGPIENIRLVLYNLHHDYFDQELRQAMTLAIDRDVIVDGLWGGLTDIPNGFQRRAHGDMYIADHPELRYDPDLARELVAQSVYDGEAIQYFILNNYYTNEVDTAQLLVEMWEDIGVTVEITVMENFSQVNQMSDELGHRLYGMRNTSSTALYPDPVSFLWRINQPTGTVGRHNGWAAHGVLSSEFHELGPKLIATTDPEARRDIVRRMLEIYDEDPPGAILHDNAQFFGASAALGYRPQQQYFMDFGPQFFDGWQR